MRSRSPAPGFTLIELMIVVVIIGALSATAVPAFMKYVRRARTVEALMNIRKMWDSVAVYYQSEHTDENGNPLPREFPRWEAEGSTPHPDPSTVCCGQPGGKCAPDPQYWSNPIFQLLNFSVDDPHYYGYGGYGGTNNFGQEYYIAMAWGDLNCDGVTAHFSRFATQLDNNGGIYGSPVRAISPLD